MFYTNIFVPFLVRIGTLGAVLLATAPVNFAAAQLSNIFSSSGAAQTAAPVNPGVPACPPLVAGQPEALAPNGQPWTPGVNCTLQSPPGEPYGAQVTGAPLNTVDITLIDENADSGVYLGDPNGTYAADGNQAYQEFERSVEQIQGRVGLAYVRSPDYLGADVGSSHLSLLIDLDFGTEGSLNNEDGLGWRIISLGTIEGKLSLNWYGAQKFRGQTAGLSEMDNQMHLEADLVFLSGQGIGYELEFSRPLSGDNGWTLTAAAAAEIPMETGLLKARIGATHASVDWMRSYYGISTSEATATGLSEYMPGAGLRDVFAEVSVEVPFNEDIGMDLRARASRVLGPAAKAPQVLNVGSAMDYTASAALYYQF